jgi:uncharacterized protein with PhoU and TrkA domain
LSRVRKVSYKPVPVMESLIEMKDISELMIDLAYASALLDNQALATEVRHLEERMDDLVYLLNMNLMLSARNKHDVEVLSGVQRVGSLTNVIGDAAGDIARLVRRGIKIHPIAKEAFERTEENLDFVSIVEHSTLIGKTVDDLHLARRIGADIIAIKRGEHWFINPGKELLFAGDSVIARGKKEGLEILAGAAQREGVDIE